jgi:hypothetical protein
MNVAVSTVRVSPSTSSSAPRNSLRSAWC